MSVAAVVPARDEAARIGATVRGVAEVSGVDLVVVVDDGSSDSTSERARVAGAVVISHRRPRGKGAAMATGAAEVARRDGVRGSARHLLFLDADVAGSAARAGPLIETVVDGSADVAIALLPASVVPGGGRGVVVGLSRWGIRRLTGWEAHQPLSGQRCLTRGAFEGVRPLAAGFGVETGMTIDAKRRGLRVVEVEVALIHRVTGDDWRSQLHRARQCLDVARALTVRLARCRRA